MADGLDGRVALVTGAGAGIGAAVARRLASMGASVVVNDVDGSRAEEVAAGIAADGGTAHAVQGDVTDEAAVAAMVQAAVDRFGGLHIAVNNAGIGGGMFPLVEFPVQDWRRVIQVNLESVFLCLRAEIPALRAAGGGSIVNIASIMGTVAFPTISPYVAAKHGVVGLTKAAALEVAAEGIRINAVGPGFIRTPLLDEMPPEELAGVTALHPVGRLGEPEEVAELVAFLASGRASFATGSYIVLDGGYTAQ